MGIRKLEKLRIKLIKNVTKIKRKCIFVKIKI